jgi:prolyl 4-hydroxylase
MGVPQKLEFKYIEMDDFLKTYHEGINHLAAVATNPDLVHILSECKNKDPLCTQWAVEGWCDMDRHFMDAKCCPVCWSSPQLDFLQRCPMDPNVPNAWKPGDVNRFFQNLTTDEKYAKYEPRVWSRPSYLPGEASETADYEEGPWIVTLENVLTQEEANLLIEWGETHEWELSLDGGQMQPDGTWEPTVIEGRTSRQAWCDDMCYKDPTVQSILKRLSDITNIPESYSDYLQLLRYEPGQFYHTHHDFHNFQVYSATGHRILTFYTYLSDVEEGGGTNFPELNITVYPKMGRALIWPNVKDNDPNERDGMTKHQALPLIKGMKYGATAWFHMRDFKGPRSYGCDE